MLYGKELVASLQEDIQRLQENADRREERIKKWETDIDDCFMSIDVEAKGIAVRRRKIALIENGGAAWFPGYATLDGVVVSAQWCNTPYGEKLRVEMPDGQVVWTTATTEKGLAKKNLKRVECLRPAWFAFEGGPEGNGGDSGKLAAVLTGDYRIFPSRINYATGEDATEEPLAVRDDLQRDECGRIQWRMWDY